MVFLHQINSRDLSEAIEVIKTHPGNVIGFEVVEKEVVEVLQYNIDPQHTGFRWMGKTDKPQNISASRKILGFLHQKLTIGNELIVMASKPDIDSIAAATLFIHSEEISSMENDPIKHDDFLALCERVKSIDTMDCGLGNVPGKEWSPWYYEENLMTEVREFNILGAMCSDFKLPLVEKIDAMKVWLLTGELSHLGVYRDQLYKECIAQKDAKTYKENNVWVVLSEARGATGILYSQSPYGVCYNPNFPTPTGTINKFTICEFTAGKYLNLEAILNEILQIEPGWGGNIKAGIIGSPFAGTGLGTHEVSEIVSRYVL